MRDLLDILCQGFPEDLAGNIEEIAIHIDNLYTNFYGKIKDYSILNSGGNLAIVNKFRCHSCTSMFNNNTFSYLIRIYAEVINHGLWNKVEYRKKFSKFYDPVNPDEPSFYNSHVENVTDKVREMMNLIIRLISQR